MIANEISNLKKNFFRNASPKEKVFYSYLLEGRIESDNLGQSPTDQLCRDAFMLSLSSSETLLQLRKSQAIKGIHYSTNLIDLIAAATIDMEGEKDHIKKYFSSHGLREAYLIKLALDVPIPSDVKINGPIDKLIDVILSGKNSENMGDLFLNSLESASNLFDCIILFKMYGAYLSIHPEAKVLDELEDIRRVANKVSRALNGIIMLVLAFIVVYLAVVYILTVLQNDKTIGVIEKYVSLIGSTIIIICVFLGLTIPNMVKALTWTRVKILTFIYWSLGLKYTDVLKLLSYDEK